MIFINLFTFILFGIAYALSDRFGIDWIKIVPGILLLYYLPGHNLNSILFRNRHDMQWYARLSLDILSSVSVLSIFFLLSKNHTDFSRSNLVSFVVILNLIVAALPPVINLIFKSKTISSRKSKAKSDYSIAHLRESLNTFFRVYKYVVIVMSIPILLFVIRLILNPYVYDIDSLVYFDAYKSILATGKIGLNDTFPFTGRESFPFLIMTSHYVAGMSYTAFFKFFIPILFYSTTGILFAIFRNGDKDGQAKGMLEKLSYLTILASPMLVIANENVRSETISIAITIPVLVLTYLAIRNNDKLLLSLGLFYSLAAIRFHETGYILLLSSALTFFIIFLKNWSKIYKFVANNVWMSLALVVPYLILLKTNSAFLSIFEVNKLTSYILGLIHKGLTNVKWDWWWINDATTAMGAKIGWPGYSAILYYLYDGITLLLFVLILAVILIKYRKQARPDRLPWLALLPVSMFFLIHFSLAEILPRIGIILLPNRSWPYIMLALVVISIVFIARIFESDLISRVRRIIIYSLSFCIISGVVGATFGSTFMGAMVLPQEKTAIATLRGLPDDVLITSTQRNNNLVMIYGEKNFVQIDPMDFDTKNFGAEVITSLESIVQQNEKTILDSVMISMVEKGIVMYNGKTISESTEPVLVADDDKQKLEILREKSPADYDLIDKQIKKADTLSGKKVYFLYSFAKLDYGIMSSREWWRESSNVENYNFFKNYSGNVIAKNKYFVLIECD